MKPLAHTAFSWVLRWLVGTVLTLFTLLPAFAHDTGHHADLTREALAADGFGETAIRVVQVQNWLTDYYSNSPTAPSSLKAGLEELHCDNLFTTQAIQNYHGRFLVNARDAVRQATADHNALALLTLLGVSLHTMQDFYSHSNWVETHPPGPDGAFRTDTIFTNPPRPGDPPLFTGAYPNLRPGATMLHGDYVSGLNKDSYVRPRWAEGYVFAYAVSRQWVNAVRTWSQEVDRNFWRTIQTFGDPGGLAGDFDAAFRISEWVALNGANGHWKGFGSGSLAEFLAFELRWTTSPDSAMVREFKSNLTPLLLSQHLTGDTPPTTTPPTVAGLPLNVRAVLLRTLRVREAPVGLFELKIDPGGKADFFAEIQIAGQTFIEATQIDRSDVRPFWTTIKFVPTTTRSVAVRYRLWDEDGALRGDDDLCDIRTGRGSDLNFNMNLATRMCSGDVAGIRDREARAFQATGTGGANRAIVNFFITTRNVRNP